MHTASALTSVVLPRAALGALGLATIDAIPGLTWAWMGQYAPPAARPRFIRVAGPRSALQTLLYVCADIARDRGRLMIHRQAAYNALQIIRARLTRQDGGA